MDSDFEGDPTPVAHALLIRLNKSVHELSPDAARAYRLAVAFQTDAGVEEELRHAVMLAHSYPARLDAVVYGAAKALLPPLDGEPDERRKSVVQAWGKLFNQCSWGEPERLSRLKEQWVAGLTVATKVASRRAELSPAGLKVLAAVESVIAGTKPQIVLASVAANMELGIGDNSQSDPRMELYPADSLHFDLLHAAMNLLLGCKP